MLEVMGSFYSRLSFPFGDERMDATWNLLPLTLLKINE